MIYCLKTHQEAISKLLAPYDMSVQWVEADTKIPGSFWGDSEAGLIANVLYLREDTPIHSALHEACHYICMDKARRDALHTDAAGDYDEENGVCYLQILLADELNFTNRDSMMQDMDEWGYSFRLGSTRAWFEGDAEDAREWLMRYELIDMNDKPSFKLRN